MLAWQILAAALRWWLELRKWGRSLLPERIPSIPVFYVVGLVRLWSDIYVYFCHSVIIQHGFTLGNVTERLLQRAPSMADKACDWCDDNPKWSGRILQHWVIEEQACNRCRHLLLLGITRIYCMHHMPRSAHKIFTFFFARMNTCWFSVFVCFFLKGIHWCVLLRRNEAAAGLPAF